MTRFPISRPAAPREAAASLPAEPLPLVAVPFAALSPGARGRLRAAAQLLATSARRMALQTASLTPPEETHPTPTTPPTHSARKRRSLPQRTP